MAPLMSRIVFVGVSSMALTASGVVLHSTRGPAQPLAVQALARKANETLKGNETLAANESKTTEASKVTTKAEAKKEPSDDWHKELGKGLAQYHNVDTKAGMTNATASYESVEDRVQSDLNHGGEDYEPTYEKKKDTADKAQAQDRDASNSADGDKAKEDDVEREVEEQKDDVNKKTESGGEETSEKKKEKKTWFEKTTDNVTDWSEKQVERSGAAGKVVNVVAMLTVFLAAAQA